MPLVPNSNITVWTVITWLIYLVPTYIFLIAPGLRVLYPSSQTQQQQQQQVYGGNAPFGEIGLERPAGYDQWVPGLTVTDDSFICPEEEGEEEDEDDRNRSECQEHDYSVHIFSRNPLVIYIENFLTKAEAEHLLAVSETKWSPSIITDGTSERVDLSIRRSDRALLGRDTSVRCIEDRARAFQGWRPWLYIERMWTQRYNVSGYYRHHYDWRGSAGRKGGNSGSGGGDRWSTFMVYVDANCTGGGTNFPRLKIPRDRRWCRFIECENETESRSSSSSSSLPSYEGVTFKPIKGNAIFWENLRPDGTGYPETWHAALPVLSGSKIGLNIWSWYQPPIRRGDGK